MATDLRGYGGLNLHYLSIVLTVIPVVFGTTCAYAAYLSPDRREHSIKNESQAGKVDLSRVSLFAFRKESRSGKIKHIIH